MAWNTVAPIEVEEARCRFEARTLVSPVQLSGVLLLVAILFCATGAT